MAGSSGQITKRYVSAINLLDKREIAKGVFDIWRDADFLDFFEQLGQSIPTVVPVYNLYTKDPLFLLGDTTGATIVGSGSATTLTGVALTAGSSGFATVNTLAKMPNGGVGRVTAISSSAGIDTLTIKSVDANNLTLVAGNIISFFSNAQGEGSASPTAKRWSQTLYSNQVQIFKAQTSLTDIQLGSMIETTYNGQDYYTLPAIHDSLIAFRTEIALAMLVGRKSTTLFSDASPEAKGQDAAGSPIQTTMGIDQYVTTQGVSDTLTTPGTVVTADVKDFVNKVKAVRGASRYFGLSGTAPKMEYDIYLKNLGSANVQWSMRYTTADGKSPDFTVDRFSFGGLAVDFKVLDVFDHPQAINFTGGTDVMKSMYFIGADKIMTTDGKMVDRIRTRTMKPMANGLVAPKGGNDVYREDWTGKYAGTDDTSALKVHFESCQGLEMPGAQHAVKQVVLA